MGPYLSVKTMMQWLWRRRKEQLRDGCCSQLSPSRHSIFVGRCMGPSRASRASVAPSLARKSHVSGGATFKWPAGARQFFTRTNLH
jgi:hypothetical protein